MREKGICRDDGVVEGSSRKRREGKQRRCEKARRGVRERERERGAEPAGRGRAGAGAGEWWLGRPGR